MQEEEKKQEEPEQEDGKRVREKRSGKKIGKWNLILPACLAAAAVIACAQLVQAARAVTVTVNLDGGTEYYYASSSASSVSSRTANRTVTADAAGYAQIGLPSSYADYAKGKGGVFSYNTGGSLINYTGTLADLKRAPSDVKYTLPYKKGYTFAGWEAANHKTVTLGAVSSRAVYYLSQCTSNTTVKAKWTANKFKIHYYPADSGAASSTVTTVTYGTPTKLATASSLGFSKAGFRFAGWRAKRVCVPTYTGKSATQWYTKDAAGTEAWTNALPDGGSYKIYSDGASVSQTAPNGDVYLYAQWAPGEYTITYDANGGTGAMGATTAVYGKSVTLPKNSFVRPGYRFLGWSNGGDGRVAYKDGAAMTYKTAGNTALFAVWEKSDTGFDTGNVVEDGDMFTGCINIRGENGTIYDKHKVDSAYADIDRTDDPGYFTKK